MSLDPVNKDVKVTPADLPEFNFELGDSEQKKLEEKASIFVNKKFVPVDDEIRLADVGKDGKKIIYENVEKGQMHLAKSQTDLAEEVINNEDNAQISKIFGGLFGKSKSIFNKKDNDNLF